MAKVRPTLTVAKMEQKLGFKLEASTDPPDVGERWYSDLSPVCYDLHERTVKEYEECVRTRRGAQKASPDNAEILPRPGETVVGSYAFPDNDLKF